MGEIVARWVGSDGKEYSTTDPAVVRRRIANGFCDFIYLRPSPPPTQEATNA